MSLKRFRLGMEAPNMVEADSVAAAAVQMEKTGRGAVLVNNEDGTLAGMFTERDLTRRVVAADLDPAKTTLGEVMTREVIQISEDASLDDAIKLLQQNRIRHLPLTDQGGKVWGVLSLRMLLHEEIEELNWSIGSLEGYLNDSGGG